MDAKKGQVTIFIIITIIVVALVILFFIFKDSIINEKIPTSLQPIHAGILSCLEEASQKAIIQIASQGGYYKILDGKGIIYFTQELPYYYIDSQENIPEIDTIENEMSKFVSENLNECIDREELNKTGAQIMNSKIIISSFIDQEKINFKLLEPIVIRKGELSFEFEKEIEIYSDFAKFYEVSKEIVKDYEENPGYVCITCLDELSKSYDVQILANPFPEENIFGRALFFFFISDLDDNSENKLEWVFIVEDTYIEENIYNF